MLWTPYERTSSTPPASSAEDDDDDDDDGEEEEDELEQQLAEQQYLDKAERKLRKSQSSYETSHHLLHAPPTSLSQLFALPGSAAGSVFPPHHLAPAIAGVLPVPFSKSDERRRHRNRFSYPASSSSLSQSHSASAYYGSPAHTLTQWCSSAATAIKEPPSYESLYEAGISGVGVARASLARVQPNSLQCDRSQRSRATASTTTATHHVDSVENVNDNDNDNNDDNDNDKQDGDGQQKLTANVPAERLMRSFTDDYISQVSAYRLSIITDIL